MTPTRRSLVPTLLLAAALAGTAAAATSSAPGTWRALPAAPVAPDGPPAAVWTGARLVVVGSDTKTALDSHGHPYSVGSVDVAASYDPARRTWRKLFPPGGTGDTAPLAVWTGRRVLVWGPFRALSYDPASNRWRRLPPAPTTRGFAVWTGRELIGWGGGCCGDAFTDGSAYDPTTNRWRRLPRSPLAGSQHPLAVWTGHDLIVLVGDRNPDTGKPWPAGLARGAAYDPATNRWRRIAPLPAKLDGETVAWDGHELIAAGGSAYGAKAFSRLAFAYSPSTNRWRRIASLPAARSSAQPVSNGHQVFLVRGFAAPGRPAQRTLCYDPRTNRWLVLPKDGLPARLDSAPAWIGSGLAVWGTAPTAVWGTSRPAGALFVPKAAS
jgi:hypothetical protein